jgi:hypothetical protein
MILKQISKGDNHYLKSDPFQWWKMLEHPERTTDHGQTTGKLYHLRLRVECTMFCNLQSGARNHFRIGDRFDRLKFKQNL